jgi:glycosyltransferase involved in cell wall biosynthesis
MLVDRHHQEPYPTPPLRVGIWCDYGFTYGPDEGIGVVIYNLVQGFLALEEPVEVVLLVKPGDQKRVASFTGHHDRLRIIHSLDAKPFRRFRFAGFLKGLVGKLDRLQVRKDSLGASLNRRVHRARRTLGNGWRYSGRWLGRRKIPAAIGAAIILPFLGMFLWAVYAVFRFAVATIEVLTFPGRLFDGGIRRLDRMFPSQEPSSAAVARQLACDVWIVPQVLLDQPLPFPSVVFIHDFASSHFQEHFERWYPGYHERARRLIPLRAKEAVICACMSRFIRDSDLLGVLQLPASKVRVVHVAPPADLPELNVPPETLKPRLLQRPYLFYPTAFRPYKNHAGLIEALRILRDRYGVEAWDLVFTGEKAGFLPPELGRQVQDAGLQGRLHVLGRVDRQTLTALYRCAFATIVPSFYEQGSFQIYEALQSGCPVACSRIPAFQEQCGPMGDDMLYFDPSDPDAIARTILAIRDDHQGIRGWQWHASRVLWDRKWSDVARDLLQVCKEAMTSVPSRLEAFLFLQNAYEGGVWQATKELLRALVEINRERQELTLTVGVHDEQKDTSSLEQLYPEIHFQRFQMEGISKKRAERFLSRAAIDLSKHPYDDFSFLGDCETAALRADAWLALVDRFKAPLLPLRPYGVLVYDMLQRHVPKNFEPWFFDDAARGMRPTVENAQMVLVTSPATREDVLVEYDLDPSRVQLAPVACDTHRRFAGLAAEPVLLPRKPFILNVANAIPHKGGSVLLRGYARLKKRLGEQTPLLVMCGWMTHALSPLYQGDIYHPAFQKMRMLVNQLGLKDTRDVVFLGFVSDGQLLDLYQRCAVVVNAAKYDNGSFSLIEARYFGCPVVCSRYPASEYLCERFGIPAEFFPVDDDAGLSEALDRALAKKHARGDQLEQIRLQLAASELSTRRYAERIYQCLVQLAQLGRQDRLNSRAGKTAA